MISSLFLTNSSLFYFVKVNVFWISLGSLMFPTLPCIISTDSGMNHFGFSVYSFSYSNKYLVCVCRLCVNCVCMGSCRWTWVYTCHCGSVGVKGHAQVFVGLHLPPHLKQGFFLFATEHTKLPGLWASGDLPVSILHFTEGALECCNYSFALLFLALRELRSAAE